MGVLFRELCLQCLSFTTGLCVTGQAAAQHLFRDERSPYSLRIAFFKIVPFSEVSTLDFEMVTELRNPCIFAFFKSGMLELSNRACSNFQIRHAQTFKLGMLELSFILIGPRYVNYHCYRLGVAVFSLLLLYGFHNNLVCVPKNLSASLRFAAFLYVYTISARLHRSKFNIFEEIDNLSRTF